MIPGGFEDVYAAWSVHVDLEESAIGTIRLRLVHGLWNPASLGAAVDVLRLGSSSSFVDDSAWWLRKTGTGEEWTSSPSG